MCVCARVCVCVCVCKKTSSSTQCVTELRSDYFTSRQQLSIPDLPLKGNCSFRVSVLLDGTDYIWTKKDANCTRNLAEPGT